MQDRNSTRRSGVECIEVAITLPLIGIAIFATTELAHHWHLEKMLKLATYEAVRAGCDVNGSAEDAVRAFREHAEAMGIQEARLLFNRPKLQNAEVGEMLRFQGVAPARKNRLFNSPVNLKLSEQLSSGHIFYRKEGQ